jgi:hypothetical protein
MKKKEVERNSIREWCKIKNLNPNTVTHYTRYLHPGAGRRIGKSLALTEKEFDDMIASYRVHTRRRRKKEGG